MRTSRRMRQAVYKQRYRISSHANEEMSKDDLEAEDVGNYPALLGLDCKSRPEATETVRALSTEPPDVPSGGSGWVVTDVERIILSGQIVQAFTHDPRGTR